MLDNFLIQLFHEGKCMEAYKVFGAHPEEYNGEKGVRFTVYAPHARSVQVVGDFNLSRNSKFINIVLKHHLEHL